MNRILINKIDREIVDGGLSRAAAFFFDKQLNHWNK